MSIYSNPNLLWPLLQSKTEQKFKSGLFSVSAEFICPVGNATMPTEIQTSIGLVNVWPEPTVSTGTDGFQRINATGYGVWSLSATEIVNGRTASSFNLAVQFMDFQENRAQDGSLLPYSLTRNEKVISTQYVILENIYIKKIGIDPPPVPILKVLSSAGADITEKIFTVDEVSSTTGYTFAGGGSAVKNPKINQFLSLNKINTYGNIIESEWVYEILIADISFGTYRKFIPLTS